MKYLIYAGLAFVLAGCAAFAISESSGQIGCPEEEISIQNDSGGGFVNRTWTVTCRNRKFYCTHNFTAATTSCKESIN
jgi:hypothetical protein